MKVRVRGCEKVGNEKKINAMGATEMGVKDGVTDKR